MWGRATRPPLIWLAGMALALIGLVSSPARGDDGAARDRARALAGQGRAAFDEGRYEQAIALLTQAEATFHAPTHLLYVARSHVKLGQPLRAHDVYMSILVEPIPNYAPAAIHRARSAAEREGRALQDRVATVHIAFQDEPPGGVEVRLDGKPVPLARLGQPVAVTAGLHRVAASAAGHRSEEQEVHTAVGRTERVVLRLPPLAGSASDASRAPPGEAPAASTGTLTITGITALGVGGVALVAGGITGGLTLSRASDIEDQCGGDVCPTDQEPTVDSAKRLGTASTALFAVGGVLAATGIVLLVVEPTDADEAAGASRRMGIRVGAGEVVLDGCF